MMSEQEMKSMEKYALDILKNNPSPKWVTVLQTESGSMVFSFDDLTGEDTLSDAEKVWGDMGQKSNYCLFHRRLSALCRSS